MKNLLFPILSSVSIAVLATGCSSSNNDSAVIAGALDQNITKAEVSNDNISGLWLQYSDVSIEPTSENLTGSAHQISSTVVKIVEKDGEFYLSRCSGENQDDYSEEKISLGEDNKFTADYRTGTITDNKKIDLIVNIDNFYRFIGPVGPTLQKNPQASDDFDTKIINANATLYKVRDNTLSSIGKTSINDQEYPIYCMDLVWAQGQSEYKDTQESYFEDRVRFNFEDYMRTGLEFSWKTDIEKEPGYYENSSEERLRAMTNSENNYSYFRGEIPNEFYQATSAFSNYKAAGTLKTDEGGDVPVSLEIDVMKSFPE